MEHGADTSNGNRGGAAALAAAIVIVACHFAFLMRFYEPAISTLDSHGYFVQARQIARTGGGALDLESRIQYEGYGWKDAGGGRRVSMWPPGLPVVLAAAFRAFGPEAMCLVNPLLASLSLLALFLVCRAWIGGPWGVAATACMACLPFLNEHAFYGYSHIASLFFMVWALFFVTQWVRSASAPWALAAGLFAGFVPCVRYPEALFLPAFAAYAVLKLGVRERRALASHAAFIAGAALPIAALCIANQRAFGSFTTTGYSLIGYSPATLFKWGALKAYAPVYAQQLLAWGAGYAAPLAAAGVAVLCARRGTRAEGALLALLIAPVSLLYMAYPQIPHVQSLRFLLPTLPVYMIAAAWALKQAAGGRAAVSVTLAAMLVALTAAWGLPLSVQKMEALRQRHKVLADAARAVKEHVPLGGVLIADELPCHNLDAHGRWRLAGTSALGRGRSALYGNISGEALYDAFLNDVQAWSGAGRPAYWLEGAGTAPGLEQALRRRYGLKLLAVIPIAQPRDERNPRPHAMPQRIMRGPGDARADAPWAPDYILAPAPEEFMEHLFHGFTREPQLRLYRLDPAARPAASPENDKS